MVTKPPRKLLLDTFSSNLLLEFATHCESHNRPQDQEALVTFLLDRELISFTNMQRYAIASTFNQMQKDSVMNKTQQVKHLADRFHLTPRSIWNALRYSSKRGDE